MKRFYFAAVILLIASLSHVQAAEVSVVKKDGKSKTWIDLSAVTTSGKGAAVFKSTLENDLKLSGWFQITAPGKGVVVAAGSVSDSGASLSAAIRVVSRAGKSYFSDSYSGSSVNARSLAHRAADDIVEAVRGVKGIASTKIIMIGSRGGGKDLYMCDADGGNFIRVTHDKSVCLSPNWNPDGNNVLYTSYFQGSPHVYEVDLRKKSRRKIAGYPGLNAGASYSPDGAAIALALSKDGNPEIYTMKVSGKGLQRQTVTRAASEASPVWAPDGKFIAYVSDRTGAPQVYIKSAAGGNDRRVSRVGTENVAPDWSVDGKIVWSSRRQGSYELVMYDTKTGRETQLTKDGYDYEDPSWAPDGRHIVCSRTGGYHSEVYLLDTLGDRPIRLTTISGEWYSPSWSPK